MANLVLNKISDRGLNLPQDEPPEESIKKIVGLLNREVITLILEIRSRLNALVMEQGESKVVAFGGRQPGSSSASYQACTALSGGVSVYFDPDWYIAPSGMGGTAQVYLEVVLATDISPPASGAVNPEFRLWNVTDGEEVFGSVQTHFGVTPTRYLIGPLDTDSASGSVKPGGRVYRAETRHSAATAILAVVSAAFVVRYQDGE